MIKGGILDTAYVYMLLCANLIKRLIIQKFTQTHLAFLK